MCPYFEKGTISASIYHQPYRQGQIVVRLMADHLISGDRFPSIVRLSPAVVMLSNLRLFRETRPKESLPEEEGSTELARPFEMRILD
jgi:LacI family transcriptional regulator